MNRIDLKPTTPASIPSDNLKETVVVVHGTWGGLSPDGTLKWWQPDNPDHTFIKKINAALATRGSAARCWAHCTDDCKPFSWSGANTWLERTKAAADLTTYLKGLEARNFRYHLIGHSHGGTTIVDAVNGYRPPGRTLGKIITMGTPFIETFSAVSTRRLKNATTLRVLIALASAYAIFSLILLVYQTLVRTYGYFTPLPAIGLSALVILATVWLFRRSNRQASATAAVADQKTGLAITSKFDEAWQILHHVRNSDNPIAPRSNLFVSLWRSFKLAMEQQREIARVHGAASFSDLGWWSRKLLLLFYSLLAFVPLFAYTLLVTEQPSEEADFALRTSFIAFGFALAILVYAALASALIGTEFYSAFLTPFRKVRHFFGALKSVWNAIAAHVVRKRAWNLLQAHLMGMDGFTAGLPQVDLAPAATGAYGFEVCNIPETAEQRALDRRQAWLNGKLANVTTSLSQMVLTASQVESLLEEVSKDLTLVHAAYYTDDECIEMVADWIVFGKVNGGTIISTDSVH